MCRAPLRRRIAASDGFTLVELLVVLLIVGILVAIGLPAFLQQRSKAQDGEAKVYVMTAAKAMTIWGGDHHGYGGATPAGLAKVELSLSTANTLIVSGDADSYTVSVDSRAGEDSGGRYTVSRTDGDPIKRICEHAGKGGCAAAPDVNGNSW